MNIDDMYKICQYAINKSQNGYLTSSEFNLLVNQAQTSYLDYLLGEFQQYQYGRAQARVSYSQNEDIRQRLSPLITETTLSINGTGIASYPSDYVQADAMRTSAFARVRFVQQDSLYSYYNSTIDPIATNPIYLIEPDGFKFYPITLGSAVLTYIKNAPEIIWGYCLDANGRQVYNPTAPPTTTTTTTASPTTTTTSTTSTTSTTTTTTTSTTSTTTAGPTTTTTTSSLNCITYSIQPIWYDVDLLEIIARTLKLVGVSLQIGQVEQYANQITQQGQ
jgi:hypothetical protein